MILPLIVSYSYLHYQKYTIKKEVKHLILSGLEESELAQFKFSKSFSENHLKWIDETEFEFESNMYDIVKTISSKDSVIYWCWLDVKESQIKKDIAALVSLNWNRDVPSQNQKDKLVDFYKQLISPQAELLTAPLFSHVGKNDFPYSQKLLFGYKNIPKQPPRI